MKGDNVQAHSTEGDSWTRWAHEIRRLEFEGMMEGVPLNRDSTVLELGCGDGFQLSLLRERFTRVFAIDPVNRPDQASGCAYAVAEALPFADGTFDLIVSNCVLEHLNDRGRALNESVRVLKPGGYMAHVVPSRFWKIANLLLNPIGYPLRVAEKWCATRAVVRGGDFEPIRTPYQFAAEFGPGLQPMGLSTHPRHVSWAYLGTPGLWA